MTDNMKKFIEVNTKALVMEGEHLTPEFKSIKTLEDMERTDRTKYTLENGEVYVIDKNDKESINYVPKWKLD